MQPSGQHQHTRAGASVVALIDWCSRDVVSRCNSPFCQQGARVAAKAGAVRRLARHPTPLGRGIAWCGRRQTWEVQRDRACACHLSTPAQVPPAHLCGVRQLPPSRTRRPHPTPLCTAAMLMSSPRGDLSPRSNAGRAGPGDRMLGSTRSPRKTRGTGSSKRDEQQISPRVGPGVPRRPRRQGQVMPRSAWERNARVCQWALWRRTVLACFSGVQRQP